MNMMRRAVIDPEKCDGAEVCEPMGICPAQAIEREDGFTYVNTECKGCGKCVRVCPKQAIKVI